MEVVGIDIGYSFVKTSTGILFPSKITTAEPMLEYGLTLTWGNKLFYIGTGNGTVSINKIDEEITSVLLLYALCGALEGDRCKIVTGLPIGQYLAQRDSLKALLLNKLSKAIVKCNKNIEKSIVIEDAAIYPQGLLAIDGEYVSVDIGGSTVDIAYVADGEIKHSKTLYKGMRSLHSKIIDVVNNKYECKLENDYAHKILTEGLYVRDEPQDISFLFPVYQEHVEAIVTEIREFTPNIVSIYLTGGGAEILYESIKKRIPTVRLVPNGQFTNAEIFKMWGDSLWT